MKHRIANVLLAACLTASMTVGLLPTASLGVKAAGDINTTVNANLSIRESEINQLLTKDVELPTTVTGLTGATVDYSVDAKAAEYVEIESSDAKQILKVKKRPKSNESDYKFTLKATVTANGETAEKQFPMTIRAGLDGDSYAGYVYVCFADKNVSGWVDVQQVHFFLSEDGLNWTALNGCEPIFKTGTDYLDYIESYGGKSVNFKVAEGTKIENTTEGDASVLFPFEGEDQGVRDPYLIRGCKADGSDSNKVWLLATDLNTMAEKYTGDRATNRVGNWGMMTTSPLGSTKLFIYETEDWVHWTRRYVDVGSEVEACMAWAPEAIYNPVKNNYLVYWSARTNVDGRSRDRLYCNETEDFVHFGPTKLYEQEPFYRNWTNGLKDGDYADDGYGNIDTSQLWVADGDNPYGTLFRLVKDETDNHIELMSAETVLDKIYEGKENQAAYDATDAKRITEYTDEDGNTFSTLEELDSVFPVQDYSQLKSEAQKEERKRRMEINRRRGDVVYNWFLYESVGDHFTKISQTGIEKYWGAYEGATLFKFIDRDEWCVMIDNYGNMSIRYEPYLTTDLSEPDSIQKAKTGTYGRTGGDVGTHGGMIPITVKEYNTMIDTYNADPGITNYHEIKYIPVDTRAYDDKAAELKKAAQSSEYTASVKTQMNGIADKITAAKQVIEMIQDPSAGAAQDAGQTWSEAYAELETQLKRADLLLENKMKTLPAEMKATEVYLDEDEVTICTKATDGLKKTAKIVAEADLDSETSKITFKSNNAAVASVDPKTGVVTAKKAGTASITATAPGGAKAVCKVTVKGIPSKITLNKKSTTLKLKKKQTFQIKVKLPKGTVCSKFKYKSNKSKVASVSKSGLVTPKKKGTAKITVTAGNNSKAKATITVKVK